MIFAWEPIPTIATQTKNKVHFEKLVLLSSGFECIIFTLQPS